MSIDRTTVSMDKDILSKAKKKAKSLRLPLSKYVETLIAKDVDSGEEHLVLEPTKKGK